MTCPSPLIPLLLLLLLSTTVFALKDVVDQICKLTSDYPLCVDLLNADPRTSDADMPVMVDVVIRLAMTNAKNTRDYFSSIKGDKIAQSCTVDYEYAVTRMEFAYADEDVEDYSNFIQFANDATDAVGHCHNVFSKLQPLGNQTHVFTILTEAVASIGKSYTQ
ncbi:Cell wall / vacuolar inhibitor of fructosidase 2 [Linum perenne]